MSMEQIRSMYGVPAKRGGRVKYTGDMNGAVERHGTIVSARGCYLRIKIDGERSPRSFHPTWKLEYLP